jgi:hypothetical protein
LLELRIFIARWAAFHFDIALLGALGVLGGYSETPVGVLSGWEPRRIPCVYFDFL